MKKFEKKPVIYKDKDGRMFAGFINSSTGEFTSEVEIKYDKDIDSFMEKYDISVITIKRNLEVQNV